MANLKTALKNMAWKRNKSNNDRDSSDNILHFLYTTGIEENTTNEILFYFRIELILILLILSLQVVARAKAKAEKVGPPSHYLAEGYPWISIMIPKSTQRHIVIKRWKTKPMD